MVINCCSHAPYMLFQVIYDLLVKNSGPLELREDPDQGICVAGLKHISVTSAAEIMVSRVQAVLHNTFRRNTSWCCSIWLHQSVRVSLRSALITATSVYNALTASCCMWTVLALRSSCNHSVSTLCIMPANASVLYQGLLEEGNRRRKVDSTDANAASSRSHAVSHSTESDGFLLVAHSQCPNAPMPPSSHTRAP